MTAAEDAELIVRALAALPDDVVYAEVIPGMQLTETVPCRFCGGRHRIEEPTYGPRKGDRWFTGIHLGSCPYHQARQWVQRHPLDPVELGPLAFDGTLEGRTG